MSKDNKNNNISSTTGIICVDIHIDIPRITFDQVGSNDQSLEATDEEMIEANVEIIDNVSVKLFKEVQGLTLTKYDHTYEYSDGVLKLTLIIDFVLRSQSRRALCDNVLTEIIAELIEVDEEDYQLTIKGTVINDN